MVDFICHISGATNNGGSAATNCVSSDDIIIYIFKNKNVR